MLKIMFFFILFSCTLHGFYDIWNRHQEDSGNNVFKKILRYDIWRKIWYGYLRLIVDRLDDNFICPKCGPNPSMIVCDATSLGFQRKYMKFRKHDDIAVLPRAS